MNYLLVTEENAEAIETALKQVNNRKVKNVFTEYKQIIGMAHAMKNKLSRLQLTNYVGAKYIKSSYRPQSEYPDKLHKVTCITLKVMEKGIVLLTDPEHLYSYMCNAYKVKDELIITKEQEKIVLQKFHRQYRCETET